MNSPLPTRNNRLSFAKSICETLDDKKASDIHLFKIPELSTIADYFVVATATSSPHLEALENYLKRWAKKEGFKGHKPTEGKNSRQWRVIDLGFLVVHLMDESARNRYKLENLWNATKRISWLTHSKKSKKS